MRYLLSSIALVVPCFWLPRIQAGDLSSHLYNAWLAQLIARGQAPGLSIRPQWTNVLFDLELSGLWRLGPEVAEKLAVVAAVLVFIWGAFAFASVVAGRRPWFLLPLIGVLAYGWVFHAGFFNFYLSLGLGFWALALAWHPGRARFAGAIAILALAYTAHALPVLWAAGAIGYLRLARTVRPRHRGALMAGVVVLLLVVRWVLEWRFPTLWYVPQAALVTGSDQVWVYGGKYHLLQPALLAIWGLLLARVLERGWMRLAVSVPLQIAVVTAAAVAIIPSKILLPWYQHALVYIAERMSLAVAICACAVLSGARPRPLEVSAIAGLAAVFFVCLWMDDRAINRIEERMERAVAQVPAGPVGIPRVVSAMPAPDGRADPLVHMIDRACIGRCFSYANYEASTGQFRIRAEPGNPVVVTNYADSYALQTGGYKVKPGDLPLYAVFPATDREEFRVRPLQVAESVQLALGK